MPVMKDLVPSIGSSTQTYSASVRSLPNSSPITPCSGKFFLISTRIASSAARSAAVTGSKLPAGPLLSTPRLVRKNGRMVSPDTVASSSTNAAKSMAVIVRLPVVRTDHLSKSSHERATMRAALRAGAGACDETCLSRKTSGSRVHDDAKRRRQAACHTAARDDHSGRHAGRHLCRQPVFPELDRRHRAGSRARTHHVGGRDRASVQRLLFLLRGRANSARHLPRPLRPENLHAGLRRRSSRPARCCSRPAPAPAC